VPSGAGSGASGKLSLSRRAIGFEASALFIQLAGQGFGALPSLRLGVRIQHAVSELPEVVLMLGKEEADANGEEHRQREPEEAGDEARKSLSSIAGFSSGGAAEADDAQRDRNETQKGRYGKEQDEKGQDETHDPAHQRRDTNSVSKGPLVPRALS
jgi:hypothetical protein